SMSPRSIIGPPSASGPRRSASRGCRRAPDSGSHTCGTRSPAPPRGSPPPRGRWGTRGSRAARRRPSSLISLSAADQREDLRGLLLQQLRRVGLHVQPQERLRVRGPDVAPPVVELYRQPVESVLASVAQDLGDLIDLRGLVRDPRVDLARVRVALERR